MNFAQLRTATINTLNQLIVFQQYSRIVRNVLIFLVILLLMKILVYNNFISYIAYTSNCKCFLDILQILPESEFGG